MTIQDLLAGTLSWGSIFTSSGKEPLSFSCEIMRELLFNTVFFLILQTFVCSLSVELYDISCARSGIVSLEKSTIFHVDELEKFYGRDLR